MKKIPWAKPYIPKKANAYVSGALSSSWISSGPYVDRFEKDFSARIGTLNALSVSSGTTAVYLALLAIGCGQGDEVIVPGFCFAACANMAIALGATPVYADIDEKTWCIDPVMVERLINKRTKAIIAVHTYGNVCDMGALRKIAKKSKAILIEDAAEAAFSMQADRYAGTIGDIGCFSFQATKTLATGEGGMVVAKNKRLIEKMRLIRNHGMQGDRRYWHYAIGHNFRLTNLQAALGISQLEEIDYIIAQRKRVYEKYKRCLQNVGAVSFQVFEAKTEAVPWTVAIRLKSSLCGRSRNAVMKRLAESGIETRPGFYPFSKMELYGALNTPISEKVSKDILCLPTFVGLADKDIGFICTKTRDV